MFCEESRFPVTESIGAQYAAELFHQLLSVLVKVSSTWKPRSTAGMSLGLRLHLNLHFPMNPLGFQVAYSGVIEFKAVSAIEAKIEAIISSEVIVLGCPKVMSAVLCRVLQHLCTWLPHASHKTNRSGWLYWLFH